jgi:hypothetical protein
MLVKLLFGNLNILHYVYIVRAAEIIHGARGKSSLGAP